MKRATFLGHSIHPMLVVFPLGLLITSVIWDIVHLANGEAMWAAFAFWSIVAGVIGGLIAAVPGFIDWLAIPRASRARRVGLLHMALNLSVVGLFALSLALRASDGYQSPHVSSMISGWIAVGIGAIAGWLGGELVERLGVGVDERPDVNAPSSLKEDRRELRPQA